MRKTVPTATTRRGRVDGGGGMAMMKQDGMPVVVVVQERGTLASGRRRHFC